MRVEQALRLLPPLEANGPLRGLLLASSSPEEHARWGSAAPFLTVGKWGLSVELLRRGIPQLLGKITAHLTALYGHYADALEAEDQGDQPGAVIHLLAAAKLEASVGRYGPAMQWGMVALDIAEGLNARQGEIEALALLGGIARSQGLFPVAARHYQRALVLSEAESAAAGTIDASEGLGQVALAQGHLSGAATWLGRAAQLASEVKDDARRARVGRALAVVARHSGDLAGALGRLQEVRETFERLGDPIELAHTLDVQGQVELGLGHHSAALAAFREALAWEQRAGREARVECGIRLHMAELFLALDRAADAEAEMRHAERVAIDHDLGRRLVQVYVRLGALRGRQGTEMGFVFFEQALALCHLLEPASTLEADVYHQYGLFKASLGRAEEARGWLERARELYTATGGGPSLELVDAELEQIAV